MQPGTEAWLIILHNLMSDQSVLEAYTDWLK